MEDEIADQIRVLPAFASQLGRARKNDHPSASDMVFAGSGDSFACSLFAHYLSNGLARVADPDELAQAPVVCDGKIVFLTSVSGLTKANVRLARRIKRTARKRVAITANLESPLAVECDETIRLPYKKKGTITPGTLSFTLSLLAVASRIRSLPVLRGLETIDAQSDKWARRMKIRPRSEFLFIGSGIGYALSAYAAFKIHEVLGRPAGYEHTEQLGHSKLFSLRKSDNIICFALRRDTKTVDTSRALARAGFNSQLLTSKARDPVTAGLVAAFSFQRLTLSLARRMGHKEPAFLTNQESLELSTGLIY